MACFRQGGAVGGFARPGSRDGGPHEAQTGMDSPGRLLRTQTSALWGWGGEVVNKPGSPPTKLCSV